MYVYTRQASAPPPNLGNSCDKCGGGVADFRVTVEGKIKLNGISTVATPSFNLGSTPAISDAEVCRVVYPRPQTTYELVLYFPLKRGCTKYRMFRLPRASEAIHVLPKYMLMADAPPQASTRRTRATPCTAPPSTRRCTSRARTRCRCSRAPCRPVQPNRNLFFRVLICAARTLNRHRSMPGHNRCVKVT